MSQKRTAKVVVWVRRTVQAVFFGLFLWLFWMAYANPATPPGHLQCFFFDLDPLNALATWLSSHELEARPLAWALVTVALTLVLGRVFCGWICPFGAIQHCASWCRRFVRKTSAPRDAWSPWQRAKYYLLAALIVMAVFGAHWIGIFDPFSILYRTTATALLPMTQYAVEEGATAIYRADPHVGPLHATAISEPIYRFFRDHVFFTKRQSFNGGALLLLLFTGIVLLNLFRARFWCRYVCPLGGLLGLLSKRPLMRLASVHDCSNCGRCATQCPAGADPDEPNRWRSTECFACWNCVAACNRDAIAFQFTSPLPAPSSAKLDMSKRSLLSAGIGGAAGLLLFRLSPQAQGRVYNPALIRPPGARDERAFLQRCLQCGLCMKVCPSNALHPTLFEAGLEGLWTPKLVPSIGYCEYNCNLCGQVCPTGAIDELPIEVKKLTKIGLATFDTTRCLPYAYNRECMICEEHCPLPKKAIFFTPQEIPTRDGKTIVLKQPHVDPDLCIGCGICENVCVFKDRPAIRVTSANETRHSGNRPILPSLAGSDTQTPESAPASDSSSQAPSNPYGSS